MVLGRRRLHQWGYGKLDDVLYISSKCSIQLNGGGMLESKHMTLFFSKRCQQFLYLHQMHSMNNLSSVHVIGSMVIFAII